MSAPTAAPGSGESLTPAERASPHLRSLLRYSWLVILVVLVAGAVGYELAKKQTPRYNATASVLLTNSEPVNVLLRSTGLPSGDPERDLNTDVALVKVDPIAKYVKHRLALPWTTTKLLSEVTAQLSGLSNVVEITASDTSPTRAAAIANAFAARYVLFRQQSAQAGYHAAVLLAQQRLSALTPGQVKSKFGVALQTQLQQLQTAGDLQTGASQIVGTAEVPTAPATPRPKFDAAVAGIMGLMIGCLLAVALGALRKPRARAGEPGASGEVAEDTAPERATASRDVSGQAAAAAAVGVAATPAGATGSARLHGSVS